MEWEQTFLAVKLYEMEQQFLQLQSRIRACGLKDRAHIQAALEETRGEYQAQARLFRRSAGGSRSPAAAALARAQLDYVEKTEKLLEDGVLETALQGGENSGAEAAALLAEYAVDHAVQAMQYALIAALRAMDMQMEREEQKGEAQE